ncbi:MAG: HAMP domain-containing protein, partial [Nitrospinota bacterium]
MSAFPIPGMGTRKTDTPFSSIVYLPPFPGWGNSILLFTYFSITFIITAMSIRTKFITILTLFSIVPCLVIGFVALSTTRQTIMNRITAHSAEFIYLVGERINVELFHYYESILAWSEKEALVSALVDNRSPEGTLALLQDIEEHSRSLSYLALIRADGNVVASGAGGIWPSGKDFSTSAGFQKALSGFTVMEDVKYDDVAKELTLLIFAPVRDQSDFSLVRGVALASFRWEHLSSILHSLSKRHKQHGEEKHVVLTKKNGDAIFGNDHTTNFGLNLIDLGLESVRQAAEGKEGYLIELSDHGILSMVSYAPLKNYQEVSNPGWLILLFQDYQDLLSPVQKIQTIIVIAFSVLILVLLFISYKTGKIVTLPILRISEAAKRVGQGDFKGTIEVSSQDEIQTLSESFNSMMEELESSKDSLFQSHEYMASIFSSMSDCLIMVSGGKIKEVNWATLTS